MRILTSLLLSVLLLLAGCAMPVEEPVVPAATPDPLDTADDAPEAPPEGPPEAAPPEEPANESAPPPEPLPPPAPPTPPPAPVLRVELSHGNLTGVGAATPDGSLCCVWHTVPQQSNGAVATGTTVVPATLALLVELRWEDTRFDLDLALMAPDFEENVPPAPDNGTGVRTHSGYRAVATGGTPAQGAGLLRILVDDAELLQQTGEWRIDVGAKGPAAQVAFVLAVTHATGAPLAEGHSAFG